MASSNFAKPGNVCRHRCCVVLLFVAIMLKGACAKTVLYNNSGRDIVLRIPQHRGAGDGLNIEVPAGQSVELEGAQQQRGVTIQDVESGFVAGPVDLPDNRSLEAVKFDPSTSAATYKASKLLNANVSVGNLVSIRVRVGG